MNFNDVNTFGTLIGTVVVTVLYILQYLSGRKRDTEYIEIKKQMDILAREKAEGDIRKISYQLEVIKRRIAGQGNTLRILGTNATGLLHQGREVFLDLLKRNGKIRILLLDPTRPVFQKRSRDEKDMSGRLYAEMNASFYILIDLLNGLRKPLRKNIEVRLYDEYPDRSLILLNHEKENGIILNNTYPFTEKRVPIRGASGEMYTIINSGAEKEAYRANVDYYDKLWNGAEPIELDNKPFNAKSFVWPFIYTGRA